MSIGDTAARHCSLYLRNGVAPRVWNKFREGQCFITARSPTTVAQVPFAGFIPSLHEIMMNVDCGRADDLDVDVVVLALSTWMTGSDHRVWIEIDAPYKGYLGLLASIYKPALLVLAKASPGSVPPNTNTRSAALKPLKVIRRSPERIAFPFFSLGVRSPADHADIQSACCRTSQNV